MKRLLARAAITALYPARYIAWLTEPVTPTYDTRPVPMTERTAA